MSVFTDNLLSVGGGASMKTVLEDGAHIHRKPIQKVEILRINPVVATRAYLLNFKTLDIDFLPLSCWGYSTTNIVNTDSLLIEVINSDTSAIFAQIELANKKNLFLNSFSFEFPFFLISNSYSFKITSAVNLTNFVIFGEKIKNSSEIFFN